MIKFNKLLLVILTAILASVLVYIYIDKPVATWTYYNSRVHPWHMLWEYPTHLEPLYYMLSPWVFICLVLKNSVLLNKIKINKTDSILFTIILSMWLSLIISEEMRIFFGRTWPSTWFHGNLSYIQHGVYGFNWLKTAHEYKSFPSGHATLIFACMMALWWQTQNKLLKLFAVINCFLVSIGLILMCYHWVSDVIIGALVGSICAYILVNKINIVPDYSNLNKK